MKKQALCLSVVAILCGGCARETNEARAIPTDTARPSASAPDEQPHAVGGGCAYEKLPGTCAVQPGSMVTYEGTIDGKAVKLEGNPIDANAGASRALEVGAKAPCTLDFAVAGACTPCMLSIAECGPAAWDLFRSRKR